jgi:putative hydrolase of the HAD superfamily
MYKTLAVSNEARELNAHRISTFRLKEIIDFFVSSCFVHLRKPAPKVFRMALDLAQVVYSDDREMFINLAKNPEISRILPSDYPTTKKILSEFGLPLN